MVPDTASYIAGQQATPGARETVPALLGLAAFFGVSATAWILGMGGVSLVAGVLAAAAVFAVGLWRLRVSRRRDAAEAAALRADREADTRRQLAEMKARKGKA